MIQNALDERGKRSSSHGERRTPSQSGALHATETRDGRCAPYQRPELRSGEQTHTKTEVERGTVRGALR